MGYIKKQVSLISLYLLIYPKILLQELFFIRKNSAARNNPANAFFNTGDKLICHCGRNVICFFINYL